MMSLLLIFSCALFATVVRSDSVPDLDIVELARRLGVYSYLLALDETDSTNLVANTNNITVFLPSNDAFLKLPESTRDYWRKNPAYYSNLIKYHVVQGKYMFKDLKDEDSYLTYASPNLTGRFVNYDGRSKNVQVFSGAVIDATRFNIEASNGVIHFLNDVIGHFQVNNILETAMNDSDLSTVIAATPLVGVNDTLAGSKPYTFFAPTNEAIKKLGSNAWEKLLNNTSLLREVLNLHIADGGTWFSAGLKDGLVLETLNANVNLTFKIDDKGVLINNNAFVVAADIAATNGVIHKIDTVLYPEVIRNWLNRDD